LHKRKNLNFDMFVIVILESVKYNLNSLCFQENKTVILRQGFFMVDTLAFGQKIRAARESFKRNNPEYSLRKFAAAVGISPTFLSKIEKGEFAPPAADKIIKIAELLNLDADELLALADKVDPKLNEIIREQPKEMAAFLRTASGMSADQLTSITDMLGKLNKN
jgi:transcriptional regulator with XRE-family HTH domain